MAGAFATGSFWYLRNLVEAGNPLPWVDFGFLSTPNQIPLYPRPPHSVADYAFSPQTWTGWFFPGLDATLGPPGRSSSSPSWRVWSAPSTVGPAAASAWGGGGRLRARLRADPDHRARSRWTAVRLRLQPALPGARDGGGAALPGADRVAAAGSGRAPPQAGGGRAGTDLPRRGLGLRFLAARHCLGLGAACARPRSRTGGGCRPVAAWHSTLPACPGGHRGVPRPRRCRLCPGPDLRPGSLQGGAGASRRQSRIQVDRAVAATAGMGTPAAGGADRHHRSGGASASTSSTETISPTACSTSGGRAPTGRSARSPTASSGGGPSTRTGSPIC